jgi:hypothetical protein
MTLRTELSDRDVRTRLRITATHFIFTRISCTLFTCDMYLCRLRHINDPVRSSLKMEGICLLFSWKMTSESNKLERRNASGSFYKHIHY